jgi:tRNA-splicing ligase RtcB
MNIPTIERLIKAFEKYNIKIVKTDNTYTIQNKKDSNSPCAEILLPNDFALDKKAVLQLIALANAKHPQGGKIEAVMATPDFHAGSTVPVGTVIAAKNMIIPQAIGKDIHCGMRMHTIDINYEQFISVKKVLVNKLRGDLLLGTRDLPMRVGGFKELFKYGLLGWLEEVSSNPIGQFSSFNFKQILTEIEKVYNLGCENGSDIWVPHNLIDNKREIIRDGFLGTIGGGNHFVEIQIIEEILDKKKAFDWGLKKGQLALMIHSGSRLVGVHIGNTWVDRAKKFWPDNLKHPDSGIYPVIGQETREYYEAVCTAANYANLNRLLLAELVRHRLREVVNSNIQMPIIYDSPHNVISYENELYIHRKGATPAYSEQPVLIPGSMGQASYLMCGVGNVRYLQSASHGAGRALTRQQMYNKHKNGYDIGLANIECITLKEERIVEEAPYAYKPIQPVIDVQIDAGIVLPVAKMSPILTFKG